MTDKTYRIFYEGLSESRIVEASSYAEAVKAWHDSDEDLEDMDPDTVELLCQEPVIRPIPDGAGVFTRVLAELGLARAQHQNPHGGVFAALVEEVGELAKALLEESEERVVEEAVQVAAMGLRLAEDRGDRSFRRIRGEESPGVGLAYIQESVPGALEVPKRRNLPSDGDDPDFEVKGSIEAMPPTRVAVETELAFNAPCCTKRIDLRSGDEDTSWTGYPCPGCGRLMNIRMKWPSRRVSIEML